MSTFLLFLVLVAEAKARVIVSSGEGKGMRFPALLAFGDSILDTGNNNGLQTIVKCNFPPYGRDFPGHRPTGRFGNGRIPSDMIASKLGVKDFLPPYLNTTDMNELLTGVSFASGGSGFDPLTARVLDLLTMSDQLELFKQYKKKLLKFAGEVGTDRIISNALFLISGGSNDVVNTYYTSKLGQLEYNSLPAYMDFLVNSVSRFIQGLHDEGARHIAILGLPPLGCIPVARTLDGGLQHTCSLSFNQAAVQYNSKLLRILTKLNSTLPRVSITLVDTYSPLLNLVLNPTRYGFVEARKGCCGTGLLEMSFMCNGVTSSTCGNRSSYVFWDSFHPTERAYEILVNQSSIKYASLF